MGLTVVVCALVVVPAAGAESLTVNSTADKADAVAGVACLPTPEECTLRAAIEEANASAGEFDAIGFEEGIFEGQASATIELGSGLPPITDSLEINGRTCATAAGIDGPCVGIDGVGGEPALVADHAEAIEIWGLAVTGAQVGLRGEGSRLKVQASWFGVKLDGSLGGNGTGVVVGPGSDRSLIGGEGFERKDVFAASSGDGLDVHGASGVRVLGDYFGVGPDGATPAANGGDDIEVTSVHEGLQAIGTAIGTKVSAEAAATPECDGGCNLIAGAGSNGIDLEGEGGSEAPAVSTGVAGNYLGLDAAGATAIPNAAAGVRVGQAAHTVIGGASAAAANRINGGSVGVLAGPAADGLAVRGNLVGTDSAGSRTLSPPAAGIVVNSSELPNLAAEAQIVDNEIRMEGGVAISQQGEGAWIFGNRIAGAETGIEVFESIAEHGNLIEANSIDGTGGDGILVESNANEVFANRISAAGGAGIRVDGLPLSPFGISGNLIGGDALADENVIDGSAAAAIEIADFEETANEVARNRGRDNGGPFIDLIGPAPGVEPNNGIDPPAFVALSPTGARGEGAEPGAEVRAFRKQGAEVGELQSFLGSAVADPEGNWEVAYDDAVPAGTVVAATQTSAGGTSELAIATTPTEPARVEAAATRSASPDVIPPETMILKGRVKGGGARFKFGSDEPGASFECRLDRKPFRVCSSPQRYRHLKPGTHVFKVRAVDAAGNADPTSAKRKFTIRR